MDPGTNGHVSPPETSVRIAGRDEGGDGDRLFESIWETAVVATCLSQNSDSGGQKRHKPHEGDL